MLPDFDAYFKKHLIVTWSTIVVFRGGASLQKVGRTRERSEQKMESGGWPPENFLGLRPPERQKTPLLQDRIKIMFIIDFTFWTSFASRNSLQTTNEKEKKLNLTFLLSYFHMKG